MILIEKLNAMNIPPHLVRWMAAFLLDRVQRVKVGESLSQPAYPNGGVPQGTLSGPKDLLIHINDLRTQCEIYKYVGDSTVFEICTQNSVSTIQESVTVIEKWSKENDIKINASKTKEMIIRFGKGAELIPKISIDECEIERVDHTKVLGVTLSSDLTWNNSNLE